MDIVTLKLAKKYIGNSFKHNQNIPSTKWEITHSLGRKPSVTITSDEVEVFGNVIHATNNHLTIEFSEPLIGEAYLI